jgi:hypothetical protein
MCSWGYGTIYSWRPEMDLYLPGVFAVILVLHIIAETLLESPLVLGSLLGSLLERAALQEE